MGEVHCGRILLASLVIIAGLAHSGAAQQRLVELEILVDADGEIGTAQEWLEALEQVGADRVQIRSARQVNDAAIEEIQSGRTVVIKVTGIVSGNQLSLPGARFSRRDTEGIRGYLQKLREDGAQVALAEKKAFGLTSEQLVGLNQELSAVIEESTRDRPAAEFVETVLQALGKPTRVEPDLWAELRSAGNLSDELRGLSAGTALAAALRPAGLALVPHRSPGKPIELAVTRSENADEFWPVGWPIDRPISQVEPKLFERRDIEIRGFQLDQAVRAVTQIVEVPVLFDWNSLAKKEVDPSQVLVTLVKKRHPYFMTVSDLLRQSKPVLGVVVRVDENGKPFLWIE